MKRRVGSTFLILVLLGGSPCRAAEAASAPRARVRAFTSDPAQVEALRRAGLSAGARVRVERTSAAVWLEVSTTTSMQLDRALKAIAVKAGAAGVKLRVNRAGPEEETKAVSSRPVSLDPLRRVGVRPPATADPAAGVPAGVLLHRGADPPEPCIPCAAAEPGAFHLRGPPF